MKQKDLKQIDTSLERLREFAQHSQGTSEAVHKMRQSVLFQQGHFSAKTKTLIAALWAVSEHCEPCLKFYIQQAKTFGATEAEVTEILAIATTMGGCVGEMWALKAYEAFKTDESLEASCCPPGEADHE